MFSDDNRINLGIKLICFGGLNQKAFQGFHKYVENKEHTSNLLMSE